MKYFGSLGFAVVNAREPIFSLPKKLIEDVAKKPAKAKLPIHPFSTQEHRMIPSTLSLTLSTNGRLTGKVANEIVAGLSKPQKELPAKFFYDETGSQLFEQICELEEYYPTRTETEILGKNISAIAQTLEGVEVLIEYGSGSSQKTRTLLDNLPLLFYVPIDISQEHLFQTAEQLSLRYPLLKIQPLCADFSSKFDLPEEVQTQKRTAFFPGSTIGNFHPQEAVTFLKQIGLVVGAGGNLLIGVDLKKDPKRLHQAYNDAQGVTAAFNFNMLAHINHVYGADFDLTQFYHYACYNPIQGRIEMHLISHQAQTVHVQGHQFFIHEGETILTEVSYKYTLTEFALLAQKAEGSVKKVWTDDARLFSVQLVEF